MATNISLLRSCKKPLQLTGEIFSDKTTTRIFAIMLASARTITELISAQQQHRGFGLLQGNMLIKFNMSQYNKAWKYGNNKET
jgi:hypothetical protein